VTDALRAWRAFLAGEWSLVEQFDRDGHRFLVARRTDPASKPMHGLTAREQQVVVGASLAQSNKAISIELGLSEATVSELLHTAVQKLGVRSRLELVRLFAASSASSAEDTGGELGS
jgi:DNA-binding NarL/FixJ family response regulator